MSNIFLSYNRDDRAVAERYAEALEDLGFSVWWDAGLKVGEAYDEVTEAALRAAHAVIVLWSSRAVVSRWVRSEATLALRAGTLFPVMIQPCERPIMFELTQTADLTHWTGAPNDPAWVAFVTDLDAFINQTILTRQLSGETGGSASQASPAAQPRQVLSRPGGLRARASRRRMLMIAGGAAIGASAAAGLGFLWRQSSPQGEIGSLSLAVLPFQNISGQEEQDYFSEGLSAELRAALTRNPDLQVAAPTSSREVARSDGDPQEIARRLGVAFVLQGTVAKAGNTIRVGADLIDAVAGLTRWSETFERSLADVFSVQTEIAGQVAIALAARMSTPAGTAQSNPVKATGAPSTVGGFSNVAAFEDFLQGRQALRLATNQETDQQALAWFDAAIAKDPNFAAAHVWRARALSSLSAQSGEASRRDEDRDAAIIAAKTATSLAPDFAPAHATLGWVLFNQALDVRAATTAFDRARSLAPGDADVLLAFAMFSARIGRVEEAQKDVARALVLDPLNPAALRIAGAISIIAGQYDVALGHLDRALALNPTAAVIHAFRGEAHAFSERWTQAKEAYAREPSDLFKNQGLAIVEHHLGNRPAAEQSMQVLQTQSGVSAWYQKAQVYAQWARPEDALTALESAYSEKDAGLAQMHSDRFLLPIRNHPRFIALKNTIGFV